MKKYLIISALLIATHTLLLAQQNTLEIKGSAELKVSPDQGILYLDLNAIAMNFNEAVSQLTNREKRVLKKLKNMGYEEEKVKTTNFSVRENIFWRNGMRIDSGYIATQSMVLEFPSSSKRIGEFLNQFQNGNTEAEIRFGFTLSDKLRETTKEQVLEKAVADAKKNAALLARFSDVSLGSVSKIIYGATSNPGMPMYEMKAAYAMKESAMMGPDSQGFQAQDITVTEQVTIHFLIE
ncbi:SIMPL domain-containing protein [Marinoscillum sp. MHG1-6]|uniref:SIMPL domain-containing protein n=1 Tax=Marinoscillum sp. MHG1-6 TaxID=2959627 RepID=UPI0021572A89|nr:SIMPL domain-containing protein [Marinoscillum sp. MHG1-6]